MRRPILSPEAEQALWERLDRAVLQMTEEGRSPASIRAWTDAQAAFKEAQVEALRSWPYTYDTGETPMVGDDVVLCEDEGGGSEVHRVLVLEPPFIRVGGPLLEALRAFADAHDAELHPATGQWIPQCCRLVRRTLPVPEG